MNFHAANLHLNSKRHWVMIGLTKDRACKPPKIYLCKEENSEFNNLCFNERE